MSCPHVPTQLETHFLFETLLKIYYIQGRDRSFSCSCCEYVLEGNGDRRPLPEIETAAVVHLREDRCEVLPVRLGDDIFQVFVALREVFQWETDIKGTVLGKPVDPDTKDD